MAYLCTSEDLNSEGNGSGATGLRAELRHLIRDKLPGYMLPAAFVLLRAMPRTPEGKTDRLSLPLPLAESFFTSDIFLAPRNPTEATLAGIWSSVFAVEKIGIRDNFFDLGGQSLMAVSMFIKIEQGFGRKLSLATLFRAPTIEALAAALATSEDTSGQWASLVPIQSEGTKPPLFLVHGAGGNVLLYRSLAEHLAPHYPLYGLQSRGLDGQTEPLGTIREMAEHYLREVRKVQPKGPYYLGGYCMGGSVAYEMAQRLSRDGEQVALLALLDTYNYIRASQASFASFLLEKAKFHMFNVLRLRPREMGRYVVEKLRRV